MAGIPPPPLQDPQGSFGWLEWYRQLRDYISTASSIPWTIINFASSKLTDLQQRSHSDLQNIQGGIAGERYHVTAEHAATKFDSITINKAAGSAIYLDKASPTYGWRDIIGSISVKGSGPADPTWAVYINGIKGYQFIVNDEVQLVFHLPHDWVPGTDLYIHAHWSINTAAIETVTWGFEATYAKGHQQAAFPATVTTTVAQASTGTPYYHMIAETVLTGASLLPLANIEVDGLILLRVYLSANTGAIDPFLHTADIHYQSSNIGTKQKSPSFYV